MRCRERESWLPPRQRSLSGIPGLLFSPCPFFTVSTRDLFSDTGLGTKTTSFAHLPYFWAFCPVNVPYIALRQQGNSIQVNLPKCSGLVLVVSRIFLWNFSLAITHAESYLQYYSRPCQVDNQHWSSQAPCAWTLSHCLFCLFSLEAHFQCSVRKLIVWADDFGPFLPI